MQLLPRFRKPKRVSPTLSTPALDGLTLHETLYGSLARRNSLKNLLIGALVLVLGYEGVYLTFYANKTRYLPYILVQQMRDDGSGSYHVLSTPNPHWSPTNAMAEEDVRALVRTLRQGLMDPTENTRNWERLLARTTERGRHHAEAEYWRLKEVFKTFRGKIAVSIQSVLTRQDLQTYEVLWTEERFDENNDRVRTPDGMTKWRGIFTVKFLPELAHPVTCPDGIVYDAWTITEEK
jgi:type IV secretory pathway TrbF-like protein